MLPKYNFGLGHILGEKYHLWKLIQHASELRPTREKFSPRPHRGAHPDHGHRDAGVARHSCFSSQIFVDFAN